MPQLVVQPGLVPHPYAAAPPFLVQPEPLSCSLSTLFDNEFKLT